MKYSHVHFCVFKALISAAYEVSHRANAKENSKRRLLILEQLNIN